MSAKLTRLATIRDLFGPRENGGCCECSHCVAGRELLAVVEAALDEADATPDNRAGLFAILATVDDPERRAKYVALHDAWEKLT